MLTPCLAYILWRIYKVGSKLKGFKPAVQMFNDKKIETTNISALMTNRLHALENRVDFIAEQYHHTWHRISITFYKSWARATT